MASFSIKSALPNPGDAAHDKAHQDKPVALITGITGQDGSYMTDLLLSKGYTVIGIVRPSSNPQPPRLAHLDEDQVENLQLYYGDIIDAGFLRSVLKVMHPDEVYHFAAQSNVHVSFSNSEYTTEVIVMGTLRILEAIREYSPVKKVKFYNACTSELFGESDHEAHDELSVFHPKSPYGLAKLHGYWSTRHYREAYGIFAVNGILFNHESPRRTELFVTQKIVESVARINGGDKGHVLRLGNLDSLRDWGHAKDFMDGIYMMMQAEIPDDFVLSTGVSHSVREFIELAFRHVNVKIRWEGSGKETVGIDDETGRTLVKVDPAFFRVLDIRRLQGDSSKARRVLGWHYTRPFESLVNEMTDAAVFANAHKAIRHHVNTIITTAGKVVETS